MFSTAMTKPTNNVPRLLDEAVMVYISAFRILADQIARHSETH